MLLDYYPKITHSKVLNYYSRLRYSSFTFILKASSMLSWFLWLIRGGVSHFSECWHPVLHEFIKHCLFPTEFMFCIFSKQNVSFIYVDISLKSILSLVHIFLFKPEPCYLEFYSFVWHLKVKVCDIPTLVLYSRITPNIWWLALFHS